MRDPEPTTRRRLRLEPRHRRTLADLLLAAEALLEARACAGDPIAEFQCLLAAQRRIAAASGAVNVLVDQMESELAKERPECVEREDDRVDAILKEIAEMRPTLIRSLVGRASRHRPKGAGDA